MVFSDGKGAWGRTVNHIWVGSKRTGTFRVFPNRLDQKREVVLRPGWQEMGFMPSRPEEIATGVRYYNRYFLPCLSINNIGLPNPYTDNAAPGDTFCPGLVIWFLWQARILPRWKMPVTYDIDHPLPGLESAQASGMNLQQIRYVDRCTMEWVCDFARRWGLIIQCVCWQAGDGEARNINIGIIVTRHLTPGLCIDFCWTNTDVRSLLLA